MQLAAERFGACLGRCVREHPPDKAKHTPFVGYCTLFFQAPRRVTGDRYFVDNKLLHIAMQHDECGDRSRNRKEQQGEDEERGLFAGLLRRARYTERVDESVGQEVKESH